MSSGPRSAGTETVVKLGGSLAVPERLDPVLTTLAELAASGSRLLVVPGGGAFADAVRAADQRHRPGDDAAHWMAVLAMDQMGYLFRGRLDAAGLPGALVRSAGEAALAHGARRLPVLAPFAWLRAADPLPHTWDVTSDSIAAWVAGQLGASRLVLVKAADPSPDGSGVRLLEAAERIEDDLVDPWFSRARPREVECWAVSGSDPARLRALLDRARGPGERVG